MTDKWEKWLNAFFNDDARRGFGHGWLSGLLAVLLGILAVLSVLAIHFPRWLTIPELRYQYPMELVRLAVDVGVLLVFGLAFTSIILRRKKALGITGFLLGSIALSLGAGGAEIGRSDGSLFYIGLDWFVLGVLTTATLFVPLERIFPMRPEQSLFRNGWLTDTQYFFMSHALVQLMSVLILLPITNLGNYLAITGIQSFMIKLPLLVQFVLCLIAADFTQYWVHRAFHQIPLLWRFHRVHHSVEIMDWIAGSRLHLVDVLATRGLVLLPLVFLGFDAFVLYIYLGFVSVHAVFIHANFAPRSTWLEAVLVMPRFHHWHHAKCVEAIDKNFAVHLPILDRLFGSEYLPQEQWPKTYGIAGVKAPSGYFNQFFWAFRQ